MICYKISNYDVHVLFNTVSKFYSLSAVLLIYLMQAFIYSCTVALFVNNFADFDNNLL